MKMYQEIVEIKTSGKCLHSITSQVMTVVKKSGIQTGICTVFILHTSASLIIQENADPDVLADLSNFFSKLVPENGFDYLHSAEGADDMPSHIRSILTSTSENIIIRDGKLLLGTWQGIYLWEHRVRSHLRKIAIHVQGN
ncbi:secondary thiamine-phosphate synthase enzyme YjbQ [Geminocystis herdmanii]|uniref:secondary thiamine-phosphate synthase enzyme YjbQ n=1 Tax=Geminocystis herdmanii TaxID=669359 RepID=UPI00034542AA|nr:secondary thiamine-phosphate synthase enzyme YjbQ [Geminocystis herdmanii]